jgi:hypothetical protein
MSDLMSHWEVDDPSTLLVSLCNFDKNFITILVMDRGIHTRNEREI